MSEDSPTDDARSARLRSRPARIALAVVAPLVLLLAAFAVDRAVSRDVVLRGVWIGGTSLSGLPRERVLVRLGELETRLSETTVPLRIAGKLEELKPPRIGFALNRDATAEAAMAAGRERALPAQLTWWLARWLSPQPVPVVVQVDDDAVERLFDDLETRRVPDRPFAGGLSVEGARVAPAPPRAGRVIDRAAARAALLQALGEEARGVVDLPLVTVTPSTPVAVVRAAAERAARLVKGAVTLYAEDDAIEVTLSAAQLAGALRARVTEDERAMVIDFDPGRVDALLKPLRAMHEAPPKNAELVADEKDRVSVVPGRAGTLLSASRVADALLAAAAAPARVGVLPILRGAPPEVSTEDLAQLGIKGLVSKFSTFHPCCQPRVDNIHRIADLVDGMIVKPDEIVSLNAAVGPRTVQNGFKAAPTIEEGEMVDALGGGVSQFATTFFNALFYGGYDILERAPHTYYFARYPMGHEATLSWPKPDIIFRNDTAAGMWIRCLYTDKSITVKIYGDNGGRKVRATKSGQFDIEKPPVELLPNPELEPDREKVKEGGQIGWSIVVGREITFPDGTKKEEKRKVIYKPRVRRVEVHPCRIPEGEPGHTGEKCPVPEAGVEGGA